MDDQLFGSIQPVFWDGGLEKAGKGPLFEWVNGCGVPFVCLFVCLFVPQFCFFHDKTSITATKTKITTINN